MGTKGAPCSAPVTKRAPSRLADVFSARSHASPEGSVPVPPAPLRLAGTGWGFSTFALVQTAGALRTHPGSLRSCVCGRHSGSCLRRARVHFAAPFCTRACNGYVLCTCGSSCAGVSCARACVLQACCGPFLQTHCPFHVQKTCTARFQAAVRQVGQRLTLAKGRRGSRGRSGAGKKRDREEEM